MKRLNTMMITALATAFVAWTPADVMAQDKARLHKDLGTVLALQGKPCGEVTASTENGQNDYTVTCSNGNRYRIRIDANERVTIESL